MHNHIIKFSGGKSSFTVAAWVKEKYPNHNVILYFNDVMWDMLDVGGCGCSTDYGTCQINEEDEW